MTQGLWNYDLYETFVVSLETIFLLARLEALYDDITYFGECILIWMLVILSVV